MKKKYEGDQPTTNDPNVYTSKEWQRIAPTMLIGNRTKQVSDTLSTHVLRDGVGVPLCALGHLGIFQSSTACLHQTPPLHPTISGVGPMSFCFISFHHMSNHPLFFFLRLHFFSSISWDLPCQHCFLFSFSVQFYSHHHTYFHNAR